MGWWLREKWRTRGKKIVDDGKNDEKKAKYANEELKRHKIKLPRADNFP